MTPVSRLLEAFDAASEYAIFPSEPVLSVLGGEAEAIPLAPCQRDDSGWVIDDATADYQLPEGADYCWVRQTEADDMSIACAEDGRPGEVRIAARPGTFIAHDRYYALRCRPCE